MDCVKQLPMWAQPVISAAFGAAQFGSTSTIELTSRIPNIFGNDGDYIDFKFFQNSASAWTVFGSTVSPDAIIVNDNTITITDGITSDSITLLASLSTTAWNHIRLIRNGSTIECYVATGSDSPVLELQTLAVIPIDIDIFGKNQDAYEDVYSIYFRAGENSYLSKATPSTLQGDGGEIFRVVKFTLEETGNHCIIDTLSGSDGYRIEVVNDYISTHFLRWTIGDGTTTYVLNSNELSEPFTFYPGDTVEAYVDVEDITGETPGASDVTFEGDWSPNSGTAYVGAQGGTSNFAGLKLHQILGGNESISSAGQTFLLSAAFDEITVSSTVTLSQLTNAYIFAETSGTREDSVGTDDLSENLGSLISASVNNGGFETLDAGTPVFDSWTEQYVSGSGTTVNAESSDVHAGTYSLRFDMPLGGGQTRMKPTNVYVAGGKSYTLSLYGKIGDLTNSPSFRFADEDNGTGITRSDYLFTSTSWTEYTDTVTAVSDVRVMISPNNNCAEQSIYFDNFTLSNQLISRSFGLKTSHLNAAAFTGYLRNVQIHTLYFDSNYSLASDANDSLPDGNDGTASNVSFITEDPSA